MLKVNNLSVSFNGRRILSDIDLQVPRGEILGIIGPNGVGKSTLIRAMSAAIPPERGSISVMGRDVTSLSSAARARMMAVVPQARSLPPAFTGWETVLLGRTPHVGWLGNVSARDQEIASLAMRRTDTLHLAERRINEMSGGEQQRLLLARALCQSAPVLLLDEPTTHLDLKYQYNLLDLVRCLAREDGLTIIITLHDLNLVSRYTDRVALLVNGRLEALDTPSRVLNPGLLSRAYQLPLDVIADRRSGQAMVIPSI
jgi:iron complex transport system ATP-binding protein